MSLTVPPSWSADWRRHLPVIPPERQARLLAEASDVVSGLQAAAGLRGQRALHARWPALTFDFTTDGDLALGVCSFLPARMKQRCPLIRFIDGRGHESH